MIKKIIIDIIAFHSGFPKDQIKISMSIQEDLLVSNAMYDTIIGSIESYFQLEIPLNAIDEFYTIYDMIQYVKKNTKVTF